MADLQSLKDEPLNAKWTPPEQYHLTLRFLGNAEQETADLLAESLGTLKAEPFEISGEGLDVFPSLRRPRVLVLHITPPRELLTLQKAVDHIATEIGFEPDPKPFTPHVTLARLKDDARPSHVRSYLEEHNSFRLELFPAGRFHLYRSDTLPEGAQHTILQSYPLSKRREPDTSRNKPDTSPEGD